MSKEAPAEARALAFQAWLRGGGRGNGSRVRQTPQQELLAEHHLMAAVLEAMTEEARQMLRGDSLRPEFWARVVDVIGNFTHHVHRAKEEQCFFPALGEWGLLEPDDLRQLVQDHAALREMTLDLCEGVSEGDWEKAFRLVAIYVGRMRLHLEAEEERLLSARLDEVPEERLAAVAERFAAIETRTLGAKGRAHYVEVARSLCRDVGLAGPLASLGDG